MKNGLAIVAGLLMILGASFIAAGTSSQDTTPRRTTERYPSDLEILELLFQYPYWGSCIIPSPAKLSVRQLDLGATTPTLVIAGDGATTTDGHESYPAALGAVFAWASEGYARKFLRVQFGVKGAQVSISISPNGRIAFGFR